MIPAPMTKSLLSCLLNDLVTQQGEPDYARYRVMELIEKRYRAFMDLLCNAEDDLSIILSLLEKDPDCVGLDPIKRLQSLVDYVQIAYALYDVGGKKKSIATLH
jgi:hypothetical protein